MDNNSSYSHAHLVNGPGNHPNGGGSGGAGTTVHPPRTVDDGGPGMGEGSNMCPAVLPAPGTGRVATESSPSFQTEAAGGAGGAAQTVARITPGSLPAAEEAALLRTIGHIDTGTTPAGALANKWGAQFKNWAGDLPGASGTASPYLEYRVAPPLGTSGAGPLRVVVDQLTGEMFYTWMHYGDMGAPAFVQIR